MTEQPLAQRPAVLDVTSGQELQRWYWLKTELVDLARHVGVSTAGGKVEITARLAAALDGATPPPAAPRPRPRVGQLSGPLTADTVIPAGQRCSQALRDFFREEVGPSFRFDAPMRAFVAGGAGRTLGEAVAHWYATRDRPPSEIAPQFELNRFVRAWHEQHPHSSRAAALEAWRRHRSLPVDRRT